MNKKYVSLVEDVNAEEKEQDNQTLKSDDDFDYPLYAVFYLLQNQDDPKAKEALETINTLIQDHPKMKRFISTLKKAVKAEDLDDTKDNPSYLFRMAREHMKTFRDIK